MAQTSMLRRVGTRPLILNKVKDMLPFDTGTLFIPAAFHWRDEALSHRDTELLGDMLRIRTIVKYDGLKTPFRILQYFGVPADPRKVGERVWEVVEDIRMQVFQEMLTLTGEEYRLDWSRHDRSFCLWYRDRKPQLDATKFLPFVRANTVRAIPGTEIRESRVHGFGLFALELLPASTLLSEFDGQVMLFDEYERLRVCLGFDLGRLRQHFFMEWNALSEDLVLVRPLRTAYSYINHHIDPNVEVICCGDRVKLFSIRDIKPGEELFMDYRKEPLPRGYLDQPETSYLVSVDFSQNA